MNFDHDNKEKENRTEEDESGYREKKRAQNLKPRHRVRRHQQPHSGNGAFPPHSQQQQQQQPQFVDQQQQMFPSAGGNAFPPPPHAQQQFGGQMSSAPGQGGVFPPGPPMPGGHPGAFPPMPAPGGAFPQVPMPGGAPGGFPPGPPQPQRQRLDSDMMDALIHNRADFVRLLLENGVSMHDFLTFARLEELYNTDQGPPNTLYYIVRDVVKIRAGYRYKLPHIGMAIEKLMANGFRSHYTSSELLHKYSEYRNKFKEKSQRNSESAAATIPQQHQTVASRGDGGEYKRTGSEFFARGFLRNLPTSASDTRLGEKFKIPYAQNQQQKQRPHQTLHDFADQQQSASNSVATMSGVSGNRALSNHLLWRAAHRREGTTLMGIKANNATMPSTIGGDDGLMNEAIEYAVEADEKQKDGSGQQRLPDFRYPFSDLLIWAVLTKRHEMALCMWQHGEEALAKSLIACRLYKSLANEAAEDYLEVEVCEELKKFAEEFRQLSLELLDHCYKHDDAQTLQLLTYELVYWGNETCLSLAVIVNNKQFLAHPCCQILLADLWHGGLRIRSNSNLRVIIGILFPPSIFLLEFKSREELLLQPQTAAEHQNDINDSSSSSSESSSSSSSESESEDERNDESDIGGAITERRRTSHGSNQSLNFTSIFHSKRKRHRPSSSAIKDDIEIGKQKNREPNQQQQQPMSMKEGRRRKNERQKEMGKDCGKGGIHALVTHSTLGVAVPAASSAGGSPLLLNAPLPNRNTAAAHSPTSLWTSPAAQHATTDSVHLDAGHAKWHKTNTKSAPQFKLGSISENIDDSNEGGYISSLSSPRQHLPGRISEHSNDDHSLHNSPHHSYQHHYLPDSENIGSNLSKNLGISKSVEQLGRLTVNGEHVPKGIPLPEGVTLNKKRQIKFRRKLYEFFVAPITTFWAWALSFIIFLSVLTYVLLIKTPPNPSILEWYLFAYVVAFGLEIGRKFCMSEPKKIKEKFEHFFGNYWNFITSLAVIGFIIGFAFRLYQPTSKSVGRIILAVDSVLWSMKLLDFLGVHPRFGPYITMAGKMVMNMSSIVVMLVISLLAFGLARQSITYPNEEWDWLLLRNIFYKPYFMLYGEVYADEIDTCGDEAWDEHLDKNVSIANAWAHRDHRERELACVPGHWIPPILMIVFLLIANILLISMLIAIFNNIFESTNKISQQIWLFQRYRQVMEYEATPFLPPPFTPIYHIYMFYKFVNYRNRICKLGRFFCLKCLCTTRKHSHQAENEKNREKALPILTNAYEQRRSLGNGGRKEGFALFDFSLKLFLEDDQVEKLHDFEEECMEELARQKEYERNRTTEARLHRTCDRTETILLRVNDLTSKETMLKGNVRELESRIELMEGRQLEVLEHLRQIGSILPALAQSMQSLHQQHQPVDNFLPEANQANISMICQSPSEERQHQQSSVDEQMFERKNQSAEDGQKSPRTQQMSPIPNESRENNRFRSAQSYGNKREAFDGSLAASSLATVYYPLKNGSGLLNSQESVQRRMRTTTIAGNEVPFFYPPVGTDYRRMRSASQQKFGSLASLSSVGHAKGTMPSMSSNIQSRKSVRGRYRQHDEYTSITDAINIEYENKIICKNTNQQTPPKFAKNLENEVTEKECKFGKKAEEETEKRLHLQREIAMGAGMQTEDEVEDEEEELEDEEEEEGENDEKEETLCENRRKRSSLKAAKSTALGQQSERNCQEESAFKKHSLEDLDGTELEDELRRSLSVEEESSSSRATTPNTILRRARRSFVQRQNSLFKDYEEEVGRPACELAGTTTTIPTAEVDGAANLRSHQSTTLTDQKEDGNSDRTSNSSGDYITFDVETADKSVKPK